MISQENVEIVEIHTFEKELGPIVEIEEGSIEDENLLGGKPFSFKETSSPCLALTQHFKLCFESDSSMPAELSLSAD